MKKLLTKKNVLIGSLCGVILFLLFIFSSEVRLCDPYNGSCTLLYDALAEVVQIFLPLFIFSLITYKLRDEIFETWIKFASWWTVATIILVFLAPTNDPSLLPITKGVVASFGTGVITLGSIFLVAWKWFTLNGKK